MWLGGKEVIGVQVRTVFPMLQAVWTASICPPALVSNTMKVNTSGLGSIASLKVMRI
jgi:hypothetical protein